MSRRYPTGMFPADMARPEKVEKPLKPMDTGRNFALYHNDPTTRTKAARVVGAEPDAELLLAMLGLTEALPTGS